LAKFSKEITALENGKNLAEQLLQENIKKTSDFSEEISRLEKNIIEKNLSEEKFHHTISELEIRKKSSEITVQEKNQEIDKFIMEKLETEKKIIG